MRGIDRAAVVVKGRMLACALALLLSATAAWGQAGAPAAGRWFRVTWAPSPDGAIATIRGVVFNDSPYGVTDVRVEIEGLDPEQHSVGRKLAWAVGDIAPGGETY